MPQEAIEQISTWTGLSQVQVVRRLEDGWTYSRTLTEGDYWLRPDGVRERVDNGLTKLEAIAAPDVGPYLAVIGDFVTDFFAEEGVPQRFWPPLRIGPRRGKRALEK